MSYFSNLALYFLFRGRGRFAGHRLGYLVIQVNETVLDRGPMVQTTGGPTNLARIPQLCPRSRIVVRKQNDWRGDGQASHLM